jgi:hypothetical protein
MKLLKRSKDLSYTDYKAACAVKGSAAMDESAFKALPVDGEGDGEHTEPDGDEGQGGEGDGDGDEEGGEPSAVPNEPDADDETAKGKGKGKVSKSRLDEAIAAFDAVTATASDPGGDRETFLKSRLTNGTITKSEQAELGRIWNGSAPNGTTRADGSPLRKALIDYADDASKQVVDATPILKALYEGFEDRMSSTQEQIATDGKRTREVNVALGQLVKSLAGEVIAGHKLAAKQAEIIKSLADRVDAVERQPAAPRAVRSAPTAQRPLGVTGSGDAAATPIAKSAVLKTLQTLVKSAADLGDHDTVQFMTLEAARYETGGGLSPRAQAAVRAVHGA